MYVFEGKVEAKAKAKKGKGKDSRRRRRYTGRHNGLVGRSKKMCRWKIQITEIE